MATSIESQGTTVHYSSETSPTTWVKITNVVDINGPGGQASVLDQSNLDSTAREKKMGLPDEGQLTFTLNYDPDDASHQAMISRRAARTRTEFKVTYTDATPTVKVFQGYVLGFVISVGVDQLVKAAVTVEIDGPLY